MKQSRTRVRVLVLLIPALLFSHLTAAAFETDQYNLPPIPLADIGSEVSEHVAGKMAAAVDKINREIETHQRCLTEPGKNSCESANEEQTRLIYLRSEDAIARAVFEQLGNGVVPFTKMGTWMDSHHFVGSPARYRTSYFKSIFILNPGVALTISPTVNLYGAEFGTDKIAHIFQQGYTYYKIYRQQLLAGADEPAAIAKAVRWGQKSERTFYGTLVAGVYSNGDLAANYAGLKFYQGLTHPIRAGERSRSAILEISNGRWKFADPPQDPQLLLKPFISDHLNEALNPSIFTSNLGWRWYIRRTVKKKSCEQWFRRDPYLTRSALEERSQALKVWQGEDYGFTDSEHFITIANTCFEDGARARPASEPGRVIAVKTASSRLAD